MGKGKGTVNGMNKKGVGGSRFATSQVTEKGESKLEKMLRVPFHC